MTSVDDKLAMGRLYAATKMPYFAHSVWHLIPTPNDEMDIPLGVSKDSKLMYNESLLEGMRPEHVGYHMLRVANHIIRGHNEVQPTDKDERKLVNLAMDLAINGDLHDAIGFAPDGSALPSMFGFESGLGWYDYYQKLKDLQDQQGKQKQQPAPGMGAGRSGSGGTNPVQGEPDPNGEGGGENQQQDSGGRSENDQVMMRLKVANDLIEAQKAGKLPGTMQGLLKWATDMLGPPKISWQTMLRRYLSTALKVAKAGSQTTTYARPSRRQAIYGYGDNSPVVPRMIAHKPSVWAVLDTSGSMWGDNVLEDSVTEVAGIISAAGGNVTFISGDCKVGDVVKANTFADIKNRIAGGGGTDFRPPFEYANKQRKQDRPDVLIYITDGCGPAPENPPKFQTIWVLIGQHSEPPAKWGKFVNLENARKGK